jgi:two-component system response regulator FixJ
MITNNPKPRSVSHSDIARQTPSASLPDLPVYIVDDEPEVCRAMSAVFRACGQPHAGFTSSIEFLDELSALAPGIIVSDICMPHLDGLELLQELAMRGRKDPVIIITGHADVPLAVRALKSGAVDFIEKPFDADVILDAIASLRIEPVMHDQDLMVTRIAALSRREQQVFERIVEGGTNKSIAASLSLSPRTVEYYRAQVMHKLKTKSLSELIKIGMQIPYSNGDLMTAARRPE